MPAHLIDLDQHRCVVCGAKATVLVRNTYNAHIGYFCRRHGAERVAELNKARGLWDRVSGIPDEGADRG